jgi:hypothetical protein
VPFYAMNIPTEAKRPLCLKLVKDSSELKIGSLFYYGDFLSIGGLGIQTGKENSYINCTNSVSGLSSGYL